MHQHLLLCFHEDERTSLSLNHQTFKAWKESVVTAKFLFNMIRHCPAFQNKCLDLGDTDKIIKTSLTLNPLYVQLPNFISQFWSSNGNHVMSTNKSKVSDAVMELDMEAFIVLHPAVIQSLSLVILVS